MVLQRKQVTDPELGPAQSREAEQVPVAAAVGVQASAVQVADSFQPEQSKVLSLSLSLSPSHGPLMAPEAETVPAAAAAASVVVAPPPDGAAAQSSCTPTHIHRERREGREGERERVCHVSVCVCVCVCEREREREREREEASEPKSQNHCHIKFVTTTYLRSSAALCTTRHPELWRSAQLSSRPHLRPPLLLLPLPAMRVG